MLDLLANAKIGNHTRKAAQTYPMTTRKLYGQFKNRSAESALVTGYIVKDEMLVWVSSVFNRHGSSESKLNASL